MRKSLLLLALAVVAAGADAMKIATDEIDEFTGKRTLVTSWESLEGGVAHIRFRHQNDKDFLDYRFTHDDVFTIVSGEKMLIKSTNDEIATFSAVGDAAFGIGYGAVGFGGTKQLGTDATYSGDIAWLKDNTPRLMRLNSVRTYRDRQVSAKDAEKIQKLARLYCAALNNEEPPKYVTCTLVYLKKPKLVKEWEVVNEEVISDAMPETINRLMEEWRAQSDDHTDYDVQARKGGK